MSDSLQFTGRVRTFTSVAALHEELAGALLGAMRSAVADRGVCHLALSGGSTPEPFYRLLVMDPRFRSIPWEASHLWLVDERCVPLEDARSNWRMIRESLLDHVPMRSRRKHAMTDASEYERELRASMPQGRLDFVLLGMGEDGHTASLFPESPALRERERWVVENRGPTVTPPDRLTMTYPLLNAAREVAVLVTGAKKAATLARVAQGGASQALPILGIRPAQGRLSWFLDAEAGKGLEIRG